MSKLLFAAALVAAFPFCALPARAASHHAYSERIYYSDLDLSTPRGAQAMLKRITETAVELCAPSHSPLVRSASDAQTARCQSDAIDHAVARLQAPMVTAEYERIRLQQRRMAAAH